MTAVFAACCNKSAQKTAQNKIKPFFYETAGGIVPLFPSRNLAKLTLHYHTSSGTTSFFSYYHPLAVKKTHKASALPAHAF
jgi:hypothetical protein